MSKIIPLLDCVESLGRDVTYYSVDVSRASIVRGLERLSPRYKHITLVGLWGTFDDVKEYLKHVDGPTFLACFGAEIANDPWKIALADLASWVSIMRPSDYFLLSADGTQDREKIWHAYHNNEGFFEKFVRMGITRTNEILGHDWFKDQDWALNGELRNNPLAHCFVFTALRDVICVEAGVSFPRGQRIESYNSHRYTPDRMRQMFRSCQLKEVGSWQAPVGEMSKSLTIQILEKTYSGTNDIDSGDYLLALQE